MHTFLSIHYCIDYHLIINTYARKLFLILNHSVHCFHSIKKLVLILTILFSFNFSLIFLSSVSITPREAISLFALVTILFLSYLQSLGWNFRNSTREEERKLSCFFSGLMKWLLFSLSLSLSLSMICSFYFLLFFIAYGNLPFSICVSNFPSLPFCYVFSSVNIPPLPTLWPFLFSPLSIELVLPLLFLSLFPSTCPGN